MRRRDFIRGGLIGSAAAGLAGCSAGKKILPLKSDMAGFSLEVKRAKPSPGTIAKKEIGHTGIMATRFGYGSHMPKELVKYERERETMLRSAFDLGITFFDIYDKSWEIYQMEPMSRHLAPIKNDVVLSVFMEPWDGRTPEQEMARTLRLFRRDYIDMVRYYTVDAKSPIFNYWDKLFEMKEKGLIRAVGMPIHYPKEADHVLERFPLDYVILPFNFYHNLLYNGKLAGDMHPFARNLRKRGVGIVTMKPFGTDWFVNPLIAAAKENRP